MGLGLPLILQIFFLGFVLYRLSTDELFKEFRQRYKITTLYLVIVSVIVDLRLFKFIYSNIKDRFDLRTLREADLRRGWRYPKRSYQILSLLMVPLDLALLCIALSLLLGTESDERLKKVSLERVIICIILMGLTVLEYYMPSRNCCERGKTVIVAPQEVPKFDDMDKSDKYRVISASVLTDVDHMANRSILL